MDNLSEQVILIVTASVFLLIVAVGIVLLVFIYQKKQIHYVREKEQLKTDFEKQILESKLEIQEQTFRNISQEIHDNIGQVLSLVKLTVNTMQSAEPVVLQQKVQSCRELITKAIQDLRNLSKSLNTDYVSEMGLLRSVEYELEMLQHASSIKVELRIEGEPYRLEQKKELIIFRIFQELLQNIIKHANATAVVVQFTFHSHFFYLQVADNGTGFQIKQPDNNDGRSQPSGLGLRNMNHRARLITAEFTLDSSPGKGTTVNLKLPMSP
jgi:two-component system, NarL family, sensor kinase